MPEPVLKRLTDVSPPLGAVDRLLEQAIDEARHVKEGAVADYIPELANVDPELFGVSLTTCDGYSYAAGDADAVFTIQSVSKTFAYAAALERFGREKVLRRVGVEPTGDAFNSIVLDQANNRPFNPMVNAGAIATTDLLMEGSHNPLQDLQDAFQAFAGEALAVDENVYLSEKRTGHRNRAIAYLMLNSGMIKGDPEEVLDVYFQQCSQKVACRTLSVMAATLANEGRNPVTGQQVLSESATQDVLTVLASCGMYNYAGQWAFEIGLPAKSGVSGALLAIAPGQFGVAIYAPPIDQYGSSLRGVEVCRILSQRLNLHAQRSRLSRLPVLRREYLGFDFASSRLRPEADCEILRDHHERLSVLETQGPLFFVSVETLARRLNALRESARYILLDFRRAQSVDPGASSLLADAIADAIAHGAIVLLSHADAGLRDQLQSVTPGSAADQGDRPLSFETTDIAIEWCEDQVLARVAPIAFEARRSLASLDLFDGFTPEEICKLEQHVLAFIYEAGEVVLRAGDVARVFFVISSGRVAVMMPDGMGSPTKIASLGPGLAFGEMALLDDGPRSATVIAEERLVAYGLPVAMFKSGAPEFAEMQRKLMENFARQLSARLRRANEAIRTLL